jgi:protein tyrosine/serine phosphatase
LQLRWEGCFNVRDLGGLRLRSGGTTPMGQLVRADGLDQLTAVGWAALVNHGVRTIVDLRNSDELHSLYCPPSQVRRLHLPLDGQEDRAFWSAWESSWQFGTPLYFEPHLRHMPERSRAALRALIEAPAGGVVFHCSLGRDRTGMLALLALSLWGVEEEEAIADYHRSRPGVQALLRARGLPDHQALIQAQLARSGHCLSQVIRNFLAAAPLLGVSPAEFQRRFPVT